MFLVMNRIAVIHLIFIAVLSIAHGASDKVDPRRLEVGGTYRVSELTQLMPEMKSADPLAVVSDVKRIPPGGAFVVDALETVYRDTWYKVRAIDSKRKPIGPGFINMKDLLQQEITPFGVSSVKVTRQSPKPVNVAAQDTNRVYSVVSVSDLNFQQEGSDRIIKRKLFRIALASELPEERMREIAGEIVGRETGLDAARLLFFLPGTDPAGLFTAGMCEWSPKGQWNSADLDKPKKLTVEKGSAESRLGAIANESLPVEKKEQVFADMMSVEEQGKDYAQGRAAVAKKHNVSIQQIKSIVEEGVYRNWYSKE